MVVLVRCMEAAGLPKFVKGNDWPPATRFGKENDGDDDDDDDDGIDVAPAA